jgi:deazaflavin-dependent oxidoreductase (nitroreductase family)
VVVGSNAGRGSDPAWVANLRAQPAVRVRVGRRERALRAREVHGEERERAWALAAAAFPGYEVYATRTSRAIPVFVLEPTGEADEGAT